MSRKQAIEKNQYNHIKLSVIGIFAIIGAAFSILSYFSNTTEQNVLDALNKMEAYKVGGQENWGKLQTLYTSSEFSNAQKAQIDDAIAGLGSLGNSAPPSGSDNNTDNTNSLTEDQVSSILGNIPLIGNKDSNIVFIEYSDFDCPFCQRQVDNKIEEALIDNYDIAYSMKQFPLAMHPDAQKAAEGALCIRNLVGDDAFFQYRDEVFASRDTSIANLTSIANTIGANESEFTECLDSNKMASVVADQMNEGQSVFGVNGTPGNVLINKTTGKYVVINGAQPLASFENAMTQVL